MIPFDRVVVVGIGLVGGSWALALRRAGFRGRIVGVDPDPRAVAALDAGAVDELFARALQPGDLRAGDLAVLAAPVGVSTSLAADIGATIPAGVVVTDVGSVKRAVCSAWAAHTPPDGGRFVGGHPMAGSHRSGFAAARADLFDDVPYYLVTGPDVIGLDTIGQDAISDDPASTQAGAKVVATVTALGARAVLVDPAAHDRSVAVTSHVPQLLSWALDAVVRDALPELPGGPGLADMTRLAASDRRLWEDVLVANADELLQPLTDLIDRLAAARGALADLDHVRLSDALASTSLERGWHPAGAVR